MNFPRFVYKSPGRPGKFMGKRYGYVAVADEIELAERLAQGWFETREEAILGVRATKVVEVDEVTEPTREEMEQKARELDIKFDGRTSDKKLNSLIDEALRGLD